MTLMNWTIILHFPKPFQTKVTFIIVLETASQSTFGAEQTKPLLALMAQNRTRG